MRNTSRDEVLNKAIDVAKYELDKNGVLAPFGCVLVNGKIDVNMAMPDEEDLPTRDVLEMLKEGIRKDVENGRATIVAVCFEIRLLGSDGHDAVCVQIETRDEGAVVAYLPYTKDQQGQITYGDIWFEKREREFFIT